MLTWLYVALVVLVGWYLLEPLPDPPVLRSLTEAAREAREQANRRGRRMLVWRTGTTYQVIPYGDGGPVNTVFDRVPAYAASPEGMENTEEWREYLARLDHDRAVRRAEGSPSKKRAKSSRRSLSRRIGG